MQRILPVPYHQMKLIPERLIIEIVLHHLILQNQHHTNLPLLFMTTSSRSVRIGSLIFECEHSFLLSHFVRHIIG
jgi:hypothetical protein